MNKDNSFIPILAHILLGALFCLALGFFFYRTYIFRIGMPTFQFLVAGVAGATFYTLIKYRGPRVAWLIHSLLLIVVLLIARVNTPLRIGTIVLNFLAIAISVLVYVRYIVSRLVVVRVGKLIPLSIIYCICSTVLTLLYGLIIQFPNILDSLKAQFNIWILIGAGLGLGLEFTELKYPNLAERES